MTFIIIDLEATCCDQNSIPKNEMEIIEIGAVAVDQVTLKPLDEYSTFIQAVRNPKLTDFCKKLTTIHQDQVDSAIGFKPALQSFMQWYDSFDEPIFCSWGYYDKSQFLKDCKFHQVNYPFSKEHINLKENFAKNQSLEKSIGLRQALEMHNLKLLGTHHRGIDDARNMVRLMPFIFSKN